LAVTLDTYGLSALADGDPMLMPILRHADSLAVPASVLGEFRYGIRQSRRRAGCENWLEEALPAYRLLLVDETAWHYADVRSELKAQGRPIPSNDLGIAALARQHALPLIRREGHFDSVPKLKRVNW
jgi:predicted nucleic acid-binding protein